MEKNLEKLTRAYYKRYYKDDLRLKDWQVRVESRLNEEQNFGEPNVRKIEEWLNLNFRGQRVLVVGAGTGAETLVLANRGATVSAIEPDVEALKILHTKVEALGLPEAEFKLASAEDIPFSENHFDFVYCYTVLEHVRNVERSIDEMIRVCKVGGLIYIQTPDYRFPYEGHYKIDRIPFSPRWLTSLQLRLTGRLTPFIHTINFLNGQMLNRLFLNRNLATIRVDPPWLLDWTSLKKTKPFWYWLVSNTNIRRDQFIFLRKLTPRI